ncbi:MAG: hypothetical protein N2234_05780 [Planctomycetota bacterium]|nr:hypothetical protein [Planctomycetota bacterium]
MVRFVSFVMMMVVVGVASGDVVILRNGHRLEGEVVELNGQFEVRMRYGSIFVRREDVLRVERGLVPWKEFERRMKGISEDDVEGGRALIAFCEEKELREEVEVARRGFVKALRGEYRRRRERAGSDIEEIRKVAFWCDEMGLREEYEEVMGSYWRMRVDSALKGVDRSDSKALVLLALKLRSEGVPEVYLRVIFEMALLYDGECFEARLALGMQLFEGQWLFSSQVDFILRRREDERMARSGYIYLNGKWVRPDVAAILEKERVLQRLENDLRLEGMRLKSWEGEIKRKEQDVECERRRLESERRRYEEELRIREETIRSLRYDNCRLVREVYDLRNENRALKAENERLRAENERLRRELEEERRNSSSTNEGRSERRRR